MMECADGKTIGTQGLAGWIIGTLRGWRDRAVTQQRQLRIVESLSLGGKRQLMLVSCGEERFLVGCGSDSVETMARVEADAAGGFGKICG